MGYTQGMFPEVYALDDSRIAWVFPMSEADPATGAVDLGKVWCEPIGEGARFRTPTGKGAVSTRYGFLDGRLAAPVENVAGFTQEWYEDVWPDIDIVLSSNQSGPVLYFVCHPGSHPEEIRLQFHGQDSLKFVDDEVRIYKENQWIRLDEATAYQIDDENEVSGILNWTANWEPNSGGGTAGLTFEEYDPDQMVVFKVGYPEMPPAPPPTDDPEWCTYFASQTANDFVTGEYVTADANLLVCGHTNSYDFPASDAVIENLPPSQCGYLTKFSEVHLKEWSYLFGPSARCLTVDEPNQVVFVAGGLANNDNLYTQDRNTGNTADYFHPGTSGTYDQSWIAAFSYPISGSVYVSLEWCTHFRAEVVTAMTISSSGDLWMTGMAGPELEQANDGPGSPWTQTDNYDHSAFVAHFNPASELIWCTWIGGYWKDWGLDIAIHEGTDRVAVVGQTKSNAYVDEDCEFEDLPPFPLYDGGHWYYCACGGNSTCNTVADGFIALFNLDGERQTISYFGGRGSMPSSVDFDPQGNLYVAGHLSVSDYTTGACMPPDPDNLGFPHCTSAGWFDVSTTTASMVHYLARFSSDLDLQWSTVLNSAGDFTGLSYAGYPEIWHGLNLPQVDVDEAGAVYFAASTQAGSGTNTEDPFALQTEAGLYYTDVNNDAGLTNPPPYYNTGQNIYIVKLSPSGSPLYGSFFGGRGAHRDITSYQGGAGDLLCELKVRNDQVYLGGCTNSYSFFPFAFTPPAYFSGLPPDPTIENGPNVWNGFIANVSDLINFDVGMLSPVQHEGTLVYPNPLQARLNIRIAADRSGIHQISVFDATGRIVLQHDEVKFNQGSAQLDVSGLAPGAYRGVIAGSLPERFSFVKE